jgi:hypothetical protein
MTKDIIELVANLALTLSFIVGLIFGVAQVKAASRDRKERLTLDTLRNFQTHEFAELIIYVNNFTIPPTLEEWRKLPESDQVTFLEFTQQMESLGILVADKFINIDLVDKTLGSFVTNSWNKMKTVIIDIREKSPDPFLSEYFQWLAEQLEERMRMNPRKPFHEQNITL